MSNTTNELMEVVPESLIYMTNYNLNLNTAENFSDNIIKYLNDNTCFTVSLEDWIFGRTITIKGIPNLKEACIEISELSENITKVVFIGFPLNKEGELCCYRAWNNLKTEKDFYRTFNDILFN